MPNTCDKPEKAPRRFWPLALKIIGVHLVIILAILIPVAIHENRQAERDWNEFKAHWEAKGEIFDLEKLVPPEVPDEENFAKAPIIAEVFEDPHNGRLASLDFNRWPGLTEYHENYINPLGKNQQALGGYEFNLAYYLESPTDYSDDKAAAADILKKLEPLNTALSELDQASHRPKARFPINYENLKMDTRFVFLDAFFDAAKTLHLRTRCRLALGDSNKAVQDILINLKMADMVGSDPTLISHNIENSIYSLALQDIWSVLQSNQFTNELPILNRTLQKVKIKPRLTRAIRFTRTWWIRIDQQDLEYYYRKHYTYDEQLVVSLVFKHIGLSQAFWARNRLSVSQIFQDHLLTTNGKVNHGWLDLEASANCGAAVHKIKPIPFLDIAPYSIFVSGFDGFLEKAQSTAQTATRIDLARVAIALELYRREHGSYPATLAALAPSYLDTVPADLITGDPLHYRIKPDGTPIIYSVGLNKTDDGGLLKRDRALGDWVWQYTLPADFDEKDWRE